MLIAQSKQTRLYVKSLNSHKLPAKRVKFTARALQACEFASFAEFAYLLGAVAPNLDAQNFELRA